MRLEAEFSFRLRRSELEFLTKLARVTGTSKAAIVRGYVQALVMQGYDGASDKVWISLWPAEGVSWPPEPMMNWQLGSDGMGVGRMSKRITTREY